MSLLWPRRSAGAVEKRNAWESIAELIAASRGGSRTYSGVPVDDEQALRLGAVWQCVDLLAELVSTLPVDEYRRAVDGPPLALPPSPLLVDPAGDDSGFEVWSRQVMESLLLRGNAYGFIYDVGDDTYPRHIETLHPDRVSVKRDLNQGPVDWFLDGKAIDKWPDGPLWHLASHPTAGSPIGRSPIRYAAESIGVGIAARKFGAQWFGDGAHPTSVLENETQDVEDEAEAVALKKRVKAALYDNREPLVLGGGWKLNPIQVSPEESQFLDTIKANADDVARFFFRRPPGEGGEITYANVEARSIDLLTYTVNGWLVRLERALTRLRPRGRFVKFNEGALLRVDLKTRYEAHVLAIRGGFGTPNERRGIEDLTPLPGGDELLWPPFSTGGGTAEDDPIDGGDAA